MQVPSLSLFISQYLRCKSLRYLCTVYSITVRNSAVDTDSLFFFTQLKNQHLCDICKQTWVTWYNLVPINGRWRRAAGKVTVGWPCFTEFNGPNTYGLKVYKKKMNIPHIRCDGIWQPLPFYLLVPPPQSRPLKMLHF